MSDAKTYTEREVVLRERRAFVQALVAETPMTYASAAALAARAFPLPTVTRPRVVEDPCGVGRWGVQPAYADGPLSVFYVSDSGERESCRWPHLATPERVTLWADLLANPTETVEDES